MFCSNCGTKITEDESRFCPNCGMPIVTKPNDYSSKIIFTIIILLVIGFVGYIFYTDFNRIKSNPEVAVKLKKAEDSDKKQNDLKKEKELNFNIPPSNPVVAKNNSVIKKDSLSSQIAIALSGFRHSLDIGNSRSAKGKVIQVKLFLDGQTKNDALNAFASFFSVCYGNKNYDISYANISLLEGGKNVLFSMGIGRMTASKISSGTWKRFDKMGNQLKSFVLSNQNSNPGSNENACYFFEK